MADQLLEMVTDGNPPPMLRKHAEYIFASTLADMNSDKPIDALFAEGKSALLSHLGNKNGVVGCALKDRKHVEKLTHVVENNTLLQQEDKIHAMASELGISEELLGVNKPTVLQFALNKREVDSHSSEYGRNLAFQVMVADDKYRHLLMKEPLCSVQPQVTEQIETPISSPKKWTEEIKELEPLLQRPPQRPLPWLEVTKEPIGSFAGRR